MLRSIIFRGRTSGLSAGLLLVLALLLCIVASVSAHGRTPAVSVRGFIEAVAVGAEPVVGGRILQSPDEVAAFYTSSSYRHIWTGDGALAGQLADLVASIRASLDHGFNPERYHADALQRAVESRRATLAA